MVIGPLVNALLLLARPSIAAIDRRGALLLGVVVPVLYLVLLPDDLGGFNSEYAVDLISAHWVAVAAFVLHSSRSSSGAQYGQEPLAVADSRTSNT